MTLTDAQLAAEFVAEHKGFHRVYDVEPEPLAAWVGTRWDIKNNRYPLKQAIYRFLLKKHSESLAPDPDAKIDPSRILQQSDKTSTVATAVEYELPPIQLDRFDGASGDYLLALPNKQTVDLRTGVIRESRMEDYLTRRIYVAPVKIPTPRFDLFMDEITLNDGDLRDYLLRLLALCLTGQAEQILVFWHGVGANGKGVLIRMLIKLLGADEKGFVAVFRPAEIAQSGNDDDRQKRAFAQLPARRLVCCNESVSERLDFSMLKLLSGGDTLTGAKMRQDAKPIRPTWKCIFPTNAKPELPPDNAFRSRVHFVPFNAKFERNTRAGRELEVLLENELPGILYKLIRLCPDVVDNGLRPPDSVLAATNALFDDMDFVGAFRAERLTDGGFTAFSTMSPAVAEWARTNNLDKSAVKSILRQLYNVPGVSEGKVYIDGKQYRGYVGVTLTATTGVPVSS
jgi:P4 family phage/plasmid primase-like protien